MERIKKWIPNGVPCLIIVLLLFCYIGSVMGLTNMLNTIMKTAHDLLLNTVFYLMGMCVITGALSKILIDFGVVGLLQKALKPVMRPLYNMPGVASLGAIMTFLSDNPVIITLSKDKGFSRYFKKYQFISMANFGTAFGMGLLVIVFMLGQGYYTEPFIGLFGAAMGGIVATRLMQYFVCKRYPSFKGENVQTDDEISLLEAQKVKEETAKKDEPKESTFVQVLNCLLDGGKDGVSIGLAIIPGVLIISTFVMMLTFGGSNEGMDAVGNSVEVYTGGPYEGTGLLPWLGGKLSWLFEWLFGFTAPELISFPITALGTVGAALSLIPEFESKGIIDGNAIAVFTAMGMCWSGFLSTHTAMLDTMGYRQLLSKDFISQITGGIFAGFVAHWSYVGIMAVSTLFSPTPTWTTEVDAYLCQEQEHSIKRQLTAYHDNSYKVKDWYGEKGFDLCFEVTPNDSMIHVTNAYASKNNEYYFVRISKEVHRGEPSYAVLYPGDHYSEFYGTPQKGALYVFAFIYDGTKRLITRGYYELVWGGSPRQTGEAEEKIRREMIKERIDAIHEADSIQKAQLVDSILLIRQAR